MKGVLVACCFLLMGFPAFAATSIPFTINLSEAVNVTGTPRIPVDVGGVTRYATYSAGTGTSTLTFTYSMTEGDIDLDGVALSSPIQLNGGTIKDLNGNDATLTFTVPNTSGVKVNYPSLGMDFIYDADGRYTLSGTAYNDLTTFLSAAGGSFTRASTATYFDSSGVLQTAASGVPRFDFDPANANAPRGILIEEARTNVNRNSVMNGVVAGVLGSGGAIPTGWQPYSGVSGLTLTINGSGTENGLPYIEIRYSGTPTATQSPNFGFETATNITSSSGQIWTGSIYHKLVAGSLTNASGFNFEVIERNGTGTFLTSSITNFTPSATRTRTTVTRTFNNASTGTSNTKMNFNVTNGMPIDFTLRLYAPQQELGTFATSFIPTSGAAATRAADAFTIPTGAWYNSSVTTLSAQYSSFAPNGYSTRIASLNEPTSLNVFQLADASAGIILAQKAVGGSILNSTGPAYVAGTTYKIAGAMDSTSGPFAVNNTLYSNTNAGLPAGITRLQVGSQAGSAYLNGWIKNLKYYPARVTNTQLQLLTQ